MQNGKTESYKDFMCKVTARFSPWNEEQIRTILRENFANFEPERSDQYVACLQKAWERKGIENKKQATLEAQRISREEAVKFAASPEEQERRRLEAEQQYGPEFCPTCGEKAIPCEGWYSKIYHMPGWKCNGSPAHFLKWARENRRR